MTTTICGICSRPYSGSHLFGDDLCPDCHHEQIEDDEQWFRENNAARHAEAEAFDHAHGSYVVIGHIVSGSTIREHAADMHAAEQIALEILRDRKAAMGSWVQIQDRLGEEVCRFSIGPGLPSVLMERRSA